MDLLKGTLDVLVLKALSGGPLHGYGVTDWIRTVTRGVLEIEDGALYTSLHRMEDKGWLESEWGVSPKGRRARFYTLTGSGREQLAAEERTWSDYAEAVSRVFAARPAGEA